MANDDEAIRLIKALAALGADPFWVYEAIAAEQEAAKGRLGAAQTDTGTGSPKRPRPQLRIVAADPE
jgi:hypothetical protein